MASPIRAPMDIEPLGNIGGLLTPREDFVPNIQSVYGDIIQNAPDYQYFTAPLSNQGRTTATYGGQNNIVVAPDTPIRVVDNATGQVVYSGVGYEGAQGAIDAANALSASTGKKANWDIQVAGPTMQGFESVSTDRPDVSGLGILADVALPVAGSLLAGPLGLGALGLGAAGTAAAGAALGSGLSSAAQGRSLEDALLRAAIAGGTSYLGGQLFGPSSPTSPTAGGINADLIPNALEGLNFGSIASTAVPAGVTSGLTSDIIVNAIQNAAPSLVAPVIGSALNVVPSLINQPTVTPDEIVVTAQTQQPVAPPITPILPSSPTATPPTFPEDIVVTAPSQTTTPLPDVSSLLTLTGVPTTPAPTTPPVTTEDIVVTAPSNTNVITPPLIPPVFQPPTTTPPATTPTDTTPPAKKDDFLGTGLSLTQLATITGLGTSLLSSLLGGGGTGTTPTTPYVSPFGGLGGGLGGGMDFRATPAIADYERYGFGPEATFFRPEYNRLVSTGAAMSPTSTTPTSQYNPLI